VLGANFQEETWSQSKCAQGNEEKAAKLNQAGRFHEKEVPEPQEKEHRSEQ
jgi:hypothetical protein